MKTLKEVHRLESGNIGIYKQHWKEAQTPIFNSSVNRSTLKLVKKNGVKGCWFEPYEKWVNLKWLKNHGFKPIAERILVLNSVYGDKKRYFVKRKDNGNLILTHVDISFINEHV